MNKKNEHSVNSEGGPIIIGNVDNRGGVVRGRSDKNNAGLSVDEAGRLFDNLFNTVDRHSKLSNIDKNDLKTEIEELRQELSKQDKADEGFLMRHLRNIGRMAPDILAVTLATIVNPAAGFGLIAVKIAEKIKQESK